MFRTAWHSFRNTRFYSNVYKPVAPWLYWSPAVIFLTQAFYVPMQISGRSMQPTLNPNSSTTNDIGIFDRASAKVQHEFNRNDIVAFKSPFNKKQLLIKRIVGIPGDKIQTLPPYPDSVVIVPEGHLWVEGDEPFFSDDSNLFGPIPAGLVESKLVAICYPFDRMRLFTKPEEAINSSKAALRKAVGAFQQEVQ